MVLCHPIDAAQAAIGCKIAQIAELHVARAGNSPYVDGQINGQSVRVLLDTGSYDSFVTGGAARRLQLRLRGSDATAWGVAGTTIEQLAVVDHLRIGTFSADDLLLHVVGPTFGRDENDAGFVLGADFFAHFTTEFDLAHDAVRLLRPRDCQPEQLVYWDQDYFLADLERLGADNALLNTHASVNGQRMLTLFDTGAGISVIDVGAARQAGVDVRDPGVQATSQIAGIAGTGTDSWIGRFDSVSIGNETIRNARLRIANLFGADRTRATGSNIAHQSDNQTELILGADFFQSHRVIISPEAHAALFTYAGGKVFQLVRPDADVQSATGAPPAASGGGAAATTP